tara:strand:- start:738 stop:1334 length:597 start_codon:yes stop_codon:yes gene_type:complete
MIKYAKKSLYAAALLCAVSATGAFAQTTVNVPVTASIDNTVTVNQGTPMNFGTIVAIPSADQTTTTTISTDGNLTTDVGGSGSGAISSIVDDSAATPATVEISDAADGAELNITIENVVGPSDGGTESFTMDTFTYRFNNQLSEQSATIDTAFQVNYNASVGGGINTLDIGATITGGTGDSFTSTSPYTGSFDVTVNY